MSLALKAYVLVVVHSAFPWAAFSAVCGDILVSHKAQMCLSWNSNPAQPLASGLAVLLSLGTQERFVGNP